MHFYLFVNFFFFVQMASILSGGGGGGIGKQRDSIAFGSILHMTGI